MTSQNKAPAPSGMEIMNGVAKIDGQLEIDMNRGVIYFHRADTGQTLLRVGHVGELKYVDPGWKPSFIDIYSGVAVSVLKVRTDAEGEVEAVVSMKRRREVRPEVREDGQVKF